MSQDPKMWQHAGPEVIISLLQELREGQTNLANEMRNMSNQLNEHVATDERILKDIYKSFPEGDIEGHRRYHEAVIENMQVRAELVRACLKAVASAGLITGIGFTVKALWYYLTK